jgi:hypothetical protein
MNELGKFCPPPRLTATPRQVERVTQLFWESANAASPDLLQQVTSQLLALLRAQGCALPVVEELAQKVTVSLQHECERFSGDQAWVHRGFRA